MAHKAAGNSGGGGIEGIAPPTGPGTAFLGIGLYFAAIWFAVKHPASAGRCVLAGAVVTGVLLLGGITDANPMQHPFIGLLVVLIGFTCAPDKSQDHKKGNN